MSRWLAIAAIVLGAACSSSSPSGPPPAADAGPDLTVDSGAPDAPVADAAADPKPIAMTYTSEKGVAYPRFAWVGQKVAILSESSALDPKTMSRMLKVFDDVYRYYASATGKEPTLELEFQGKTTIADVPNGTTCGAGCSYLGLTGIELAHDYFVLLYDGVKDRDQWDQVTFYEFGRNFWFYDASIGLKKPDAADGIVTGFAVLMRFMSMDAVGVTPAPFSPTKPFATFRADVEKLVDAYVGNASDTWQTTLQVGKAPTGVTDLGATDLFASFVLRLVKVHGAGFVPKLWPAVFARPNAATSLDAADNFVVAASLAARTDLGDLFATKWKWPVSANARTACAAAGPAATLASY